MTLSSFGPISCALRLLSGSCPSCGAVVAAVGPVAVGVREVVVGRGGGGQRRHQGGG